MKLFSIKCIHTYISIYIYFMGTLNEIKYIMKTKKKEKTTKKKSKKNIYK